MSIPILSHIAGQTIVREKTLIVFDELQLCERALTALKYFCENAPDYHIIVADSLLGGSESGKVLFPCGKGGYEATLSYGYGGISACIRRGCSGSRKQERNVNLWELNFVHSKGYCT